MAPRGRPPLPRGIISFEPEGWTPPEALLLDTTVVVEALLPSQPHHAACIAFFERVGTSGTTLIFNRLLETEAVRGSVQHRPQGAARQAMEDGALRRTGQAPGGATA